MRLTAAGILFASAAILWANSFAPPRLPWATPTVTVGTLPLGVDVDPASNTIYVANLIDNTISVIDGQRCNGRHDSHCSPVATMTNVGYGPLWPAFDAATHTLYVTNALTDTGDNGNTVAVLDVSHCTAGDTSGCNQAPVAIVTVPGLVGSEFGLSVIAIDSFTHTLYVGEADDGPVSMINTATCNALQTGGCNETPSTMTNGDGMAIDSANHSVYINNLNKGQLT